MNRSAADQKSSLPVHRIRRNFGVLLSSSVTAGALGMLALALNTRALSLADIGSLTVVQAYGWLISGLVTFATHMPLMRMGSAAIEHGDTDKLYGLVHLALIVDICSGFAAAGVTLLCATLAAGVLDLAPAVRLGLSVYVLPLFSASLASGVGMLRLAHRFDVVRTIEIGGAAVTLITVLLLWWLHAPLSAYFVAYAVVFGALPLVRYVVGRRILVRQHPPVDRHAKLQRSDTRSFLRFAGFSSLAATIETLRTSLDIVIASYLFAKEVVGIYGVAKQLAGAISKFTGFTTLAAFVEISAMFSRGEVAESRRLIKRICQLSLLIGVAAVIVAALVGRPVLAAAFGEDYAAAYGAFVIFVCAAALQFVSMPVTMYVQIARGAGYALVGYCVGLAGFLGTIVLLAPRLGVQGIAAAGVIYFALSIAVGLVLLRQRSA